MYLCKLLRFIVYKYLRNASYAGNVQQMMTFFVLFCFLPAKSCKFEAAFMVGEVSVAGIVSWKPASPSFQNHPFATVRTSSVEEASHGYSAIQVAKVRFLKPISNQKKRCVEQGKTNGLFHSSLLVAWNMSFSTLGGAKISPIRMLKWQGEVAQP